MSKNEGNYRQIFQVWESDLPSHLMNYVTYSLAMLIEKVDVVEDDILKITKTGSLIRVVRVYQKERIKVGQKKLVWIDFQPYGIENMDSFIWSKGLTTGYVLTNATYEEVPDRDFIKIGPEEYVLGDDHWITVSRYREKHQVAIQTVFQWISRGVIPADCWVKIEPLNQITLVRDQQYQTRKYARKTTDSEESE